MAFNTAQYAFGYLRPTIADMAILTPRLWKQHIADYPLRSDFYQFHGRKQ